MASAKHFFLSIEKKKKANISDFLWEKNKSWITAKRKANLRGPTSISCYVKFMLC